MTATVMVPVPAAGIVRGRDAQMIVELVVAFADSRDMTPLDSCEV